MAYRYKLRGKEWTEEMKKYPTTWCPQITHFKFNDIDSIKGWENTYHEN